MYSETTFKEELKRIWTTVTGFKPHWYKLGSQDIEINDAWAMYCNARDSTLSELLLGDVKLRSHLEVLRNFGTTSGTESTMERGTLRDDKNKQVFPGQVTESVRTSLGSNYRKDQGIVHIRRGSVLDDGWWWPFKNDAWVIGGIHGLKRFHLTMASAPDDLLWDTGDARPRVLGRELLGLGTFGYALIGVPTTWSTKAPTLPTTTPSVGATPSTTPAPRIPVPTDKIRDSIGNIFAPQKKDAAQAATFTAFYAALAKVTSIKDITDGILGSEVAFDKYDFSKI